MRNTKKYCVRFILVLLIFLIPSLVLPQNVFAKRVAHTDNLGAALLKLSLKDRYKNLLTKGDNQFAKVISDYLISQASHEKDVGSLSADKIVKNEKTRFAKDYFPHDKKIIVLKK